MGVDLVGVDFVGVDLVGMNQPSNTPQDVSQP